MDEHSRSLWARVCATVNRLGSPRSPRPRPRFYEAPVASCIDLHGITVDEAYHRTMEYLNESAPAAGLREVTVITGKSGVIRKEFPYWLERCSNIIVWQQQNDGGAFSIRLKKT